MIHWVANETLVYNGTKFIIVPQFLLLPNLFSILPLDYVDTSFTKTFFLSFNLLFRFSRFHWQRSLRCPNLLHCPQIMSIHLPSMVFIFSLIGGFFYKKIVFIYISHVLFTSDFSFLVLQGVSLHFRCGYLKIKLKKMATKLSYVLC